MSLTLPKQLGISIQKCELVGNIVGSNHDRDICLFGVPALEDINLILKMVRTVIFQVHIQ